MGTGYFAHNKQVSKHWLTSIPAAFMTAVCATYILTAKIGFNMPYELARTLGISLGVVSLALAHVLVLKTVKKMSLAAPQ